MTFENETTETLVKWLANNTLLRPQFMPRKEAAELECLDARMRAIASELLRRAKS